MDKARIRARLKTLQSKDRAIARWTEMGKRREIYKACNSEGELQARSHRSNRSHRSVTKASPVHQSKVARVAVTPYLPQPNMMISRISACRLRTQGSGRASNVMLRWIKTHETDATHQPTRRRCLSTINPESSAATLSGLSARRFSAAVHSFGDDGEDHPISDPSEHDKPEPSSQLRYEWTDETIRRGKFAWVSHDRQFGVIKPSEEADSLVDGQKRDEFFFNFRNLSDGELFRHESNQDALKPKIDTDEPVTFQLRRRTPESSIHAINIHYQNASKNMVLLQWSGAIHLIRKSKAVLGHKVYAALDEARDPDELQTLVVQEYTKCRDRINWAKSHIDRSTSAKECKANFGDEVFGILDNASSVDDIQKRVDVAFWKCCNNLKLLSLTSPEKKLLRDHVQSNNSE